jgi:hypothetical protein
MATHSFVSHTVTRGTLGFRSVSVMAKWQNFDDSKKIPLAFTKTSAVFGLSLLHAELCAVPEG